MIDAIILWSLRNRVTVLTLAAALCAWGAWETVNTPVDVFPDLTAPTVTVVAEALTARLVTVGGGVESGTASMVSAVCPVTPW